MTRFTERPTNPPPGHRPGRARTAGPGTHHAAGRTVDGGGPAGLEALYATPPPWDINRPQPAFAALAASGLLYGRVLDVGCGTGEHTLMAARLGLDATGVDLATSALDQASRKAVGRGLTVRFLRQDVRRLADLGERFDVVLDSLVFHGFRADSDGPGGERAAYVRSLGAVVKPGGRYFMLGFRDEPPGPPGRVHRLAPEEIRAAFADGWRVDAIEPVTVDSAVPVGDTPGSPGGGVRGWRTALTRI